MPLALCLAHSVNQQRFGKPLLVLFDSGASHTWLNAKALPSGCTPTRVANFKSKTLAGDLESGLQVTLTRVVFPEFFKSRFLDTVTAHVFHSTCRYDAIIGRDVLIDIGMSIDFQSCSLKWDGCHVAMRLFPISKPRTSQAAPEEPTAAEQMFLNMLEEDIEVCECGCDDFQDPEESEIHATNLNDESPDSDPGNDHAVDTHHTEKSADNLGYKSKSILESKYEGASIQDVVTGCTHLSQIQQNELADILNKYPTLFSPELGTYTDEKIHLELRPDAEPHRSRAYVVPHHHQEVFKKELE